MGGSCCYWERSYCHNNKWKWYMGRSVFQWKGLLLYQFWNVFHSSNNFCCRSYTVAFYMQMEFSCLPQLMRD